MKGSGSPTTFRTARSLPSEGGAKCRFVDEDRGLQRSAKPTRLAHPQWKLALGRRVCSRRPMTEELQNSIWRATRSFIANQPGASLEPIEAP